MAFLLEETRSDFWMVLFTSNLIELTIYCHTKVKLLEVEIEV